MDIWVVSTLGLLWIMLLWRFIYMFFVWTYFNSLGYIYLGLKLLGHIVTLYLTFLGTVSWVLFLTSVEHLASMIIPSFWYCFLALPQWHYLVYLPLNNFYFFPLAFLLSLPFFKVPLRSWPQLFTWYINSSYPLERYKHLL